MNRQLLFFLLPYRNNATAPALHRAVNSITAPLSPVLGELLFCAEVTADVAVVLANVCCGAVVDPDFVTDEETILFIPFLSAETLLVVEVTVSAEVSAVVLLVVTDVVVSLVVVVVVVVLFVVGCVVVTTGFASIHTGDEVFIAACVFGEELYLSVSLA